MCGIVGFFDKNSIDTKKNIVTEMLLQLNHRGPDDSGYYIKDDIVLGHKRLSIQDLSHLGHQPMVYENLSMVYNGEVYNFNEIRDKLKVLGYSFESTSDTEVILKSFNEWGVEAVKIFNGMFAIALYDSNLNKIYLIKDRAGIKPLYYYYDDDLFLFGSELKAFHKHLDFKKEVDIKSLNLYFQYGYVPSPYSIYKNA